MQQKNWENELVVYVTVSLKKDQLRYQIHTPPGQDSEANSC